MNSNTELLNQSSIFQDFKKDIDFFRDQIEKKEKGESISINIDAYEKALYDGIAGLENNITNPDDKKIFLEIKSILLDKERQVSAEQLKKLGEILISLEETELEKTDLESLRNSIETIKSFKGKLRELRTNINVVTDPKVEEVKHKIETYKEKLKLFSKEHPIWTKALVLLLPANLAILFQKQNIQVNQESNINNSLGSLGQIKDFSDKIKGIFSFAVDWIAKIAVMFFDMPFFGAPEEMKQLLKEMKELQKVDPNILQVVGAASMGNVLEDKNISPETIELGKTKLFDYMEDKSTEWFGITGEENKKKFKKVLNKWWEKISTDKSINKFMQGIANGSISLEKLGPDEILTGLGIGVSGILTFLSYMNDEGLISLKQIGFKLLKKGGEVIVETALFFPKILGVSLGNYKLEDLYSFIDKNELTQSQKNMLMVMIYRAINTPPFSLLQHVAALPFYVVSAIANSQRAVSGGKIFYETIKSSGVDNQLKLLSGIEEKISNRQGKIYEGISKALDEYKKGIFISYAYSQAKGDLNKFKEIIKDSPFNDIEVNKFLDNGKLSDHKLTTFIDGLSESIKNLDETYGKGLPENIKAELGGVFGDTNFFKETTSKLSKNLKNASEMFKKGLIFNFYRKWNGKFKFALDSAGNIKLDDLAHFTGDVKDFKSFSEDLRQLAVHSPDIAKFIFKNMPVIILGSDVINAFKNGDNIAKEIWDIYLSFIPIVGPISFIFGEHKESNITYTDIGTTAVWLGLDTYFVYKAKSINILKLSTMPIIDTAKFIGNSIDVISRYSKSANILTKLEKIKFKGRLAIASAVLAIFYGVYKYVETNNNKLVNTLSGIAETGSGLEGVNEYILKNWDLFSDEDKKQLLTAFIARYMGFSPDMIEKYFDDLEFDGKNVKLLLTEEGKKADIVKDKLLQNQGTIETIFSKLGYNEKLLIETEKGLFENIYTWGKSIVS